MNPPNLRTKIFDRLASAILTHPRRILSLALILAISASVYAALNLRLNADTNNLVDSDRPFMAHYLNFIREFGDLDYLYVVVDSQGNPPLAERGIDSLMQKLAALPELPHIYARIESAEQLRLATRTMPLENLARLTQARAAFPPLLQNPISLDALTGTLLNLQSSLLNPHNTITPEQQTARIAAFAFLAETLLTSAEAPDSEAQTSPTSTAPPTARSINSVPQPQYLKSDTGNLYFIEILPAKNFATLAVIEQPLRKIHAILTEVRAEFPTLEIGLTGLPVLQAEEMLTANRDMTRAALSALAICTVLFIIFVGGFKRPLLLITAFFAAAAYTFGFITLVVGELNLLSNVFILVLVGVGLDYGVHVLLRYRECRANHSSANAIRIVIHTAVRGNLTGALTSSLAFFAACFTSFQGLRELGLIAGCGLILCLLAMSIILPALLVLTDQQQPSIEKPPTELPPPSPPSPNPRDPFHFFQCFTHYPKWTLLITALISVVLIVVPGELRFESNLLKLQAENLESVQWQKRIAADSASAASIFGVIVVDEIVEVERLTAQARKYPEIATVRSILNFIPPPTQLRSQHRAQLNSPAPITIELLTSNAKQPSKWNATNLKAIHQAFIQLGQAAANIDPESNQSHHLQDLARRFDRLSTRFQATPALQNAEALNQNLKIQADNLRLILEGNQLDLPASLPSALAPKLISSRGRFLIQIYPAADIYEIQNLERFVEVLTELDPRTTGMPYVQLESQRDMHASFILMSILAVLGITALLYLDFRNLTTVLLALLPLALGVLWTLRIMAILNVSFNLANFFALPIIIGLSVDAGVHLLHRYQEGGPSPLNPGATRRAVILTGLTTIIGFGALITAHHRGLQSLGHVMIIGVSACLLAALIVLPAVLSILEQRHQPQSLPPKNKTAG